MLWISAAIWLTLSALVDAQDFYQDKTIRFIVGQAAGGGYDTYTRTIARYIGKYIPGGPTTIVDNMTGAGSLVAANYIFNNAKPDGLTIGNWNSALVFNQAMGDLNVKFDARKFGWMGAPSKSVPVCLVMGFAGLKNYGRNRQIRQNAAHGRHRAGLAQHRYAANVQQNARDQIRRGLWLPGHGADQDRFAAPRSRRPLHQLGFDLGDAKGFARGKGDDRLIPFILHARVPEPKPKA